MRNSEEFTQGAGRSRASGAGFSWTGASDTSSPGSGPSRNGSSRNGSSRNGSSRGDSFSGDSSSGDSSWTEGPDWTEVPFSGVFTGQIWEGQEDLATAGPWGIVELSPTSALRTLADAVDSLERLNELQCWADAQKARLVDRIRELYEHETGNLGHHSDGEDASAAASGASASASTSASASSDEAPSSVSDDARRVNEDEDEYVTSLAAEEVGALLRLPSRAAKTLVEQSRLLVHRHKPTLTSMESGKLSWRHATTIVDECVGVPADSVAQLEKDLVETAEQSTVAKLTRQARGLREILHPEAAPVRKTRAVADRRVILEPDSDGMAWLSAYLPAEQACGIYNRLDAGARGLQAPDEPRTLTQLRADVFTDLLTHTCAADIDPGTEFRGIGATVHLTVPALTLLNQMPGAAGEGAGAEDGTERTGATGGWRAGHGSGPSGRDGRNNDQPQNGNGNVNGGVNGGDAGYRARDRREYAVLEGYGPIDPETAARLAGHAPSFTRILTHPETGAALSIGRVTYRPPKHLQDWVRARDKTCRHPGCNRAAMATEIDHTIPWHKGGRTDHDNLACLCKRHHALKTKEHWNYMQPEPGIIIAISPAGKTYTTQPPPF